MPELDDISIMLESVGGRNEDMQRALSAGLRRRREIGQLGMLTGDDVLRPMGQQMGQSVDREVLNETNRRDKADQRQLTSDYYDYQKEQSALARTMAGRKQTEVERHHLAMEEAQAGNFSRTERRRLDTGTRQLSAALDKGGTPELQTAISAVNDELAKLQAAQGGTLTDIPGQGGGSWKPQWMLGSEGKTLRNKIAAVRNVLLKKRSGGAVTPQEQERLYEELGFAIGNVDADFMSAWSDLNNSFDSGLANIFAGYDSDIVDAYTNNLARQVGSGVDDPGGAAGSPGTGGDVVADWGDR